MGRTAMDTVWGEQLDSPQHVIVIGGSAGGMNALRELTSGLPAGFGAPILVALHWPPRTPGAHRVIGGRLPVSLAADGDQLQPGRIMLAPPDRHLLVEHGHVRLSQTPREHQFRPAIDPLFRSAARAYGQRVVGVVLSGCNADGALGLLSVAMRGGLALVQDPNEAVHSAMPLSALANVPGARSLPVAKIAAVILGLTVASRGATSPRAATIGSVSD